MAGGLSQSQRQLIMQYFGGKSGLTQPSAWYISLHTGDPGDTAGSSEVSTSGTAYARQQILNIGNAGAGRWVDVTAANPNVMTNNAAITYATATGSGFGTVSWFGVWDASTSGTYYGRGQLSASVAVGAGVQVSFSASNLSLTIAPT